MIAGVEVQELDRARIDVMECEKSDDEASGRRR